MLLIGWTDTSFPNTQIIPQHFIRKKTDISFPDNLILINRGIGNLNLISSMRSGWSLRDFHIRSTGSTSMRAFGTAVQLAIKGMAMTRGAQLLRRKLGGIKS